VLILVNGEKDAATLKELSLCDNIVEILDSLLRLGLIERIGGGAAYDYAP
jgi:predicted transcriptional regulator